MNRILTVLFATSLTGCGLTPVPTGNQGKEGIPEPVGPAVGVVPKTKINYALILGIERPADPEADASTLAAAEALVRSLRIERAGENDRIILVDLSEKGGVVKTLSPKAFKAKYGSADALRGALKPPGSGSRVYDVLTEAVSDARAYLRDGGRATLVVFSPMVDAKSGPRADGYLMGQLVAFDKGGGACAFYGMDSREAHRWRGSFGSMLHRWHILTGDEEEIPFPKFGDD